MMTWLRFVSFTVALVVALPALASNSTDPQSVVQKIIGSQMEAFKADNGALAFSFASPSIKRIFKTPENFMMMVREGYGPVYRPAEVDFRDFAVIGTGVAQRVFIRGANGEAVMATYTLRQVEDGSWKITGCQIEKLPEVAA